MLSPALSRFETRELVDPAFMWNRLSELIVLAQEAGGAAAPPAGQNPPQQPSGSAFALFAPIVAAFVVLMFLSSRQGRKDQARRTEMIRSLKKNDSVVTIGGIIGSVISVSEDGSEVTLKMVDDSRIKFRADAIRDVTTKSEPAAEKT